MGYDAELAGMTLAPGAIVMIVLMPLVGKLVTRVQARWLAVVGSLASAYAIHFVAMNIDLQIDFRTAAMYRVLQSIGLALLFIPINTASYVDVPEEKGGEVSGFINLLRNLGGSVGISLVETMIARRAQFHQDELIAHVTPAQQPFRTVTSDLSAQLFHRGLSQPQAMRQTYSAYLRRSDRSGQCSVLHGRGMADRDGLSGDSSGRNDAQEKRPEGRTRNRGMIAAASENAARAKAMAGQAPPSRFRAGDVTRPTRRALDVAPNSRREGGA